jgi:hypothetical protein
MSQPLTKRVREFYMGYCIWSDLIPLGLSRATTLLHFLSAGRFPIYDRNVIEAMWRLYGVRPSYTVNFYWDTFYPQFLELAADCKTDDFRRLDKALFSYGATRLLDLNSWPRLGEDTCPRTANRLAALDRVIFPPP